MWWTARVAAEARQYNGTVMSRQQYCFNSCTWKDLNSLRDSSGTDLKHGHFVRKRQVRRSSVLDRYHRCHTGVFVGASPVCIPGTTPCYWKSSLEQRLAHLYDGCMYPCSNCGKSSVMHEERKECWVSNKYGFTTVMNCLSYAWNSLKSQVEHTWKVLEAEQVRGDDQSPYQSWHSPLRWATGYAHEVAPLLLFVTECDTHNRPSRRSYATN